MSEISRANETTLVVGGLYCDRRQCEENGCEFPNCAKHSIKCSDKETADLIEQLQQRIIELEAQLKEVSRLYEDAHQDACFYKVCAMSGEIPKEGSQPSAQPPKEQHHE